MLNVWKIGWFRFWCIRDNVKEFFRRIKWSYQRITKGFCDYDTWSLDSYYANLISESIKQLAKNTHSYPGREPFEEYEKWTDFLNKCAEKIELYNKDIPNKYEDAISYVSLDKDSLNELYKSKMWICYRETDERNEKMKMDSLRDGIQSLLTYWRDLWD